MSTLATAIHTHRFAGLLATGLSAAAALCVAAAPEPSYFSGTGALREVLVGLAVVLSLGSVLSMLTSAGSFLVVVTTAPLESGVVGRFVSALAFAGLAVAVLMLGPRGWRGPADETIVVAGLLGLVAAIVTVTLWTSLARAAGNHQLADDLRTAYIAGITGAVLSRVAASSGLPFITLAGMVAVLPGAFMSFKALGGLARQFQYGAAWAT
ncbi:MAG: hypothetical protein SFW67_15720 [Myxococcaceae bacterium]|nr:hypothetical protein [Myxococcaceae bacterium]